MTAHSMRRMAGAGGRGFSLLEVMIVLVIILAIMGLVAVNIFSARDKATVRTVQLQLGTIKESLRAFNVEFLRYPTEEEGLEVLWNKEALDPDADTTKWRAFLEEPTLRDAWNHEWVYRPATGTEDAESGRPFELFSVGPDGEEGSEDDISAWPKREGDDGFDPGLDRPAGPPSGG